MWFCRAWLDAIACNEPRRASKGVAAKQILIRKERALRASRRMAAKRSATFPRTSARHHAAWSSSFS